VLFVIFHSELVPLSFDPSLFLLCYLNPEFK
jgi:hypothetical protein